MLHDIFDIYLKIKFGLATRRARHRLRTWKNMASFSSFK